MPRKAPRAAASSATWPSQCVDLHAGIDMKDASLALMVLTLQFLRPLYRENLVGDIYKGCARTAV